MNVVSNHEPHRSGSRGAASLAHLCRSVGLLSILVSAVSVCVSPTAQAACVKMVCLLEGDQETPPNGSPGTGTGVFIIDTNANTMDYEIRFGGLTSAENNAHIHGPAGPGVPAGPIFSLALGNVKTGTWNYPESAEADILGGSTYVNIHSVNYGAGELRGQIVHFVASLTGAQEPVVSSATGTGLFVIDTAADTLSYHITFAGLVGTENNAHIHGYAPHGVPGGVLHGLVAGSPKVGVWNYPAVDESKILDGLTYVNIHSTFAGGGEIRGQIVNALCTLDGDQEDPPNASTAVGIGLFSFDLVNDLLGFDIRFSGLSGAENNAHIHGYAARGASAGPVHTLAAGSPKVGNWNYPSSDEADILGGLSYVNIHSTVFGAGEIRGQIEPSYTCPESASAGGWQRYR